MVGVKQTEEDSILNKQRAGEATVASGQSQSGSGSKVRGQVGHMKNEVSESREPWPGWTGGSRRAGPAVSLGQLGSWPLEQEAGPGRGPCCGDRADELTKFFPG